MKRTICFVMALMITISYAIPAECRMYDPKIGRFLQRDPIGYADGPNPYTYVQNNPVNYVDPTGEFAQAIVIGGASNPIGWIVIGVGFVGYVGYLAYLENRSNANVCPIQYQSDSPSEDDLSDRDGDIASKTGLTAEEVKKKIHNAKNKGLPKSGPVKNPDVAVDTNTGEIYPKIPGGGYGDSIGNIFD